jgi:hypothetical protein
MIVSKIRITLLAFSLFFTTNTIFAQQPLTVDAGSDQAICNEINNGIDTTIIGGQPTATGGIPPYTYSWNFVYPIPFLTSGTIYASDLLNDTTIANPLIISSAGPNETNLPYMVLTVTDSIGNTASDSIHLIFSQFAMHLGGSMGYYVTQGDSIHCSYGDVSGGVGNNPTHLWTPNQGLLDSTNYDFWTKPDTTIHYTLTITDSIGCSQTGQQGIVIVYVFPLGIENDQPNTNIKVYPNPASDFIQVETMNGSSKIGDTFTLHDMLGKAVLSTVIQSKLQQIDVSQLARGSYSFVIGEGTGKVILK